MKKYGSLILVAALLTGVLPPTATAAPKTVFLGYQGPLTGDSETLGIDQITAAKYMISQFNKKYRGKFKVRLIALDDEGSEAKAAEISQSVALDNRVIGVIGPAFSTTTSSSIINYANGKLAMISPSAIREPIFPIDQGIPATALKYFHRTAMTGGTQARDLFEFAALGVANPKILVIHHEDAYSLTLATQLRDLVNSDLLSTEQVPYAATSWGSTVKRILDEKVNVIIYTGYHPQAARLLKQVTDSGYKGIKALSDGSFSPGLILSAPKSALEGARLIGLTSPLRLTQKSLYESIFGKGADARGLYAAETIEATQIFLDCIAKNSLTRRKMNNCLNTYQGKSLTGAKIQFDKTGNLVEQKLPRFVIKDGAFQVFTK